MIAQPRARLLKVLAIVVGIAVVGGLLYLLFLRQPQKVTQHYLAELKSIYSTPDTLENFFANVNDVWLDNATGRLYVLDTKTSCFVVFDTGLNFLYRVGRGGDAADEFAFPRWIRSRDSMIYVSDAGHGRLKLLDTAGRYVTALPLSWPQLMNPFAVDSSGHIILNASFESDSLLALYDMSGRIVRQFGRRIKQSTEQGTLRRNLVSPMVGEDGSIYAVFQSLPYIRKYSKDLQLLLEKDLTSAAEVHYILDKTRKNEQTNPNMIHSMVGGVYYRWPYLYVNYGTGLPHGSTLFAYDAKTLELREAIMANRSAHSWDSVRVVWSFVVLPGGDVVSFDMNSGRLVKYAVR